VNDSISYDGIDEAVLLHALYHGTRPLGMGFVRNKDDFSVNDAREYVVDVMEFSRNGRIYFDYVAGRPIKSYFDTVAKTVTTALYDRDAGDGKCAEVVARLKAVKS
jgi:hypothetical protein